MSRQRDISGERFGRLTAMRRSGTLRGKSIWACRCDCGTEIAVRLSDLTCEKTKSCGCLRKESAPENAKSSITHGMTGDRLWRIWCGMKRRCNANPRYQSISVCREWGNFNVFREWALDNGYSDDLTLDRIDVFGDYAPGNCRWATYKQQENNRSNTIYITINGSRKTLTEWCEIAKIPRATLAFRLKSGWPERDLLMPVNLNNARIRRYIYNA